MKSHQILALGMVGIGMGMVACKPSGDSAQAPTQPVAEVRGTAIGSKPEASASAGGTNATTEATQGKGAVGASAAASVPTPTPTPAVGGTSAVSGEPMALGFEKLASFVYEMPDETLGKPETVKTNTVSQIPEAIRALDKAKVALKGFMLPLKVEGGLVTELLLMKDQSMCCYGAVPKITEWVNVKMGSKGVKPVMDQPVTLHGQLKVGEIRENGFLVGIYAMDGEKLVGPLDL